MKRMLLALLLVAIATPVAISARVKSGCTSCKTCPTCPAEEQQQPRRRMRQQEPQGEMEMAQPKRMPMRVSSRPTQYSDMPAHMPAQVQQAQVIPAQVVVIQPEQSEQPATAE